MNAVAVTGGAIALGAMLTWHGAQHAPALTAYLAGVVILGVVRLFVPVGATPTGFVAVEIIVAALRFAVVFELARYIAAQAPGIRGRALGLVVAGLGWTVVVIAWGARLPAGGAATYRSLALVASGVGVLLLMLRLLALRYDLDLPYVLRATMPLGAYLVLHGLLLGGATEGRFAEAAAAWSAGLWSAWALWLAISAWAGGQR